MAPTTRPRPATVTLASALLCTLAATTLAFIAIRLRNLEAADLAVITDPPDLLNPRDQRSRIAYVLIGACLQLAIAAGYTTLAMLCSRRSNAARIVTWTVAGLQILATIGYSTMIAVLGIRTFLADSPRWYLTLIATLTVFEFFAVVAVTVLLAMPSANAYFRGPTRPPPRPPLTVEGEMTYLGN